MTRHFDLSFDKLKLDSPAPLPVPAQVRVCCVLDSIFLALLDSLAPLPVQLPRLRSESQTVFRGDLLFFFVVVICS